MQSNHCYVTHCHKHDLKWLWDRYRTGYGQPVCPLLDSSVSLTRTFLLSILGYKLDSHISKKIAFCVLSYYYYLWLYLKSEGKKNQLTALSDGWHTMQLMINNRTRDDKEHDTQNAQCWEHSY